MKIDPSTLVTWGLGILTFLLIIFIFLLVFEAATSTVVGTKEVPCVDGEKNIIKNIGNVTCEEEKRCGILSKIFDVCDYDN